jgi:fumarate reductase subunit D
MLAALCLPALALIVWIAGPLGWIELPPFEDIVSLIKQPLARLFLFVLISLSLFHWAHRFRFTLYDGLQLNHLFGLIAVICYGGAAAITVWAAYVLWVFP